MSFKFSFKKNEINPFIRLPLEYETNMASFMEKVETEPIVSFDDLQEYEPIEKLDFEI